MSAGVAGKVAWPAGTLTTHAFLAWVVKGGGICARASSAEHASGIETMAARCTAGEYCVREGGYWALKTQDSGITHQPTATDSSNRQQHQMKIAIACAGRYYDGNVTNQHTPVLHQTELQSSAHKCSFAHQRASVGEDAPRVGWSCFALRASEDWRAGSQCDGFEWAFWSKLLLACSTNVRIEVSWLSLKVYSKF